MADEWYRSPAWGLEDQEEFERRLRRARPTGRGQYLRIKGLALREAGELSGARSLWERVLDDPGYAIQRWASLEHLADLDGEDDPERAKALYRQLIEEDPTLNATTQMAEVRLAELLTREGTPDSLAEAGELLEAWAANRHSPFPINHFQHQVAVARWGIATGNEAITREAARRALIHAKSESPFPRHPTAGLVQADEGLMHWLRTKAASPRG